MASMLADLAAVIQAAIPTETAIFYLREPDAPATCVTLYATGGAALTDDFDGAAYGPRTVQVRVRDQSGQSAEARCEALHALFRGVRAYPAQYITSVKALSSPFLQYPPGRNGETIASFNLAVYSSR